MLLQRLKHALLDFLHPAWCPVCADCSDTGGLYCDNCEAQMEMIVTAPRCDSCALPLPYDAAPCAYCFGRGLGPIDSLTALGIFKEPLKTTLHHAKFHGRWPLIQSLAERLFEQPTAQKILEEADVIIPVPLHRHRQSERGYNQADVLASALGKLSKRPIHRAIVRAKKTEAQTDLGSRAQRMENLKRAFIVTDAKTIQDKNIVLIDDVITTASTILSCARTIKQAKPARISAVVIAVGDPKGREFEVV